MPTGTPTDTDSYSYLLSTVRQGQAAVLDTIRTWTAVTEQLTRTLRVPVPDVDLAGAVDRVFDVAEQTLAVQRQLALTLAGVATRQVDTAVETVDAALDAAEAEQAHGVAEPPQAPKAAPTTLNRKFDGRTYEERSIDELRERAAELQIEGRSSMTKDELIAALRGHRKARSAKNDAPKQEHTPDRRTYEERTVEELRERAAELEIEGRSSMGKDELIAALRQHSR